MVRGTAAYFLSYEFKFFFVEFCSRMLTDRAESEGSRHVSAEKIVNFSLQTVPIFLLEYITYHDFYAEQRSDDRETRRVFIHRAGLLVCSCTTPATPTRTTTAP